jgi:hypothetical protein
VGREKDGRGDRSKDRPVVSRWRTRRDVAAVLAILVPGLGHVYAGRPRAGLAWFFAVALGDWILLLPGVVLHAVSVWSADRTARIAAEGAGPAAAPDGGAERPRPLAAGA